MYDLLSGDSYQTEVNFLTIGDLIRLGTEHPDKVFRFLEVEYYPQKLISWRGSYGLPAIKYGTEPVYGAILASSLTEGLNQTHYGYKGGEYEYGENQEPYLVYTNSSDEEYKICGYKLEENEVVLLTKLDPY